MNRLEANIGHHQELSQEEWWLWRLKKKNKKKAKKDSIITEDPPQLKNPPELGMLLPVVLAGLDPAVMICWRNSACAPARH